MREEVNNDVDSHLKRLLVLLRCEKTVAPAAVEIAGRNDRHQPPRARLEESVGSVRHALRVGTAFGKIKVAVEDFVIVGNLAHRITREELVDEFNVAPEKTILPLVNTVVGKDKSTALQKFA